MLTPRTNRLGEFTDAELEQHYQATAFGQTCRRMGIICTVTSLACFVAIALNYLDFGWSNLFAIMVGLRTLVFVLGGMAALIAFKQCPYCRFAPAMMAYMMSIGIAETTEAVLRFNHSCSVSLPTIIIIVLMYYVFIPVRLQLSLIPSLLISFIYPGAIALFTHQPINYLIDLSIFFLLINIYGIYHVITFNRIRHNEFYAVIEQQNLNCQLQQEIAIRKATEEELRKLATTDELTGLNNRRYFMECFAQTMQASRENQSDPPLSLLLIDVDRFKLVNDTYGHDVGDLVLQHLAKLLQGNLRGSDIIARFGGEEFIALLPHTALPKAREVAQRLRQTVATTALRTETLNLAIAVSIGLVTFSGYSSSMQTAIKAADKALYQAKENGRNCVVVAGECAPQLLYSRSNLN